jgi:hypothetical protein
MSFMSGKLTDVPLRMRNTNVQQLKDASKRALSNSAAALGGVSGT